jgi:hypothetical protein
MYFGQTEPSFAQDANIAIFVVLVILPAMYFKFPNTLPAMRGKRALPFFE